MHAHELVATQFLDVTTAATAEELGAALAAGDIDEDESDEIAPA